MATNQARQVLEYFQNNGERIVETYNATQNAKKATEFIENIAQQDPSFEQWFWETGGETTASAIGAIVGLAITGNNPYGGLSGSQAFGLLGKEIGHTIHKHKREFEEKFPGRYKDIFPSPIDLSVPVKYRNAKQWQYPRDPIILDLDGDGLETVGLASNIYFDHDGDGILTKTGWAGKDDALLVWDRNANGGIDTGAELFGDFTPLPNGALAPNGFAALAALDSNGDGLIDANDPAYAELKLWRVADQNGLTGDGELISLAEAGIVSLNLANILKNQSLADGNTLARQGSFTKADGSTGGMGEFKLATDTFDTQFAEAIEVPEALQSLPNMGGSGAVRELQQAAAQSDALASLLGQFQNAGTRADQADSLRRIHFVRRKDKRRRDSAKVHKTAAQGAERKRLFSSLNDDGNYSIRVRKPCAVPLHAASVALARHYSD